MSASVTATRKQSPLLYLHSRDTSPKCVQLELVIGGAAALMRSLLAQELAFFSFDTLFWGVPAAGQVGLVSMDLGMWG